MEQYVAPALDQPNIDGVYTDCSCGNARGYSPTESEWVGRQLAFDAALALAKSKNKWMSAWTGAAVTRAPRSAADCAATMTRLMQQGANHSNAMQLQNPNGVRVSRTTIAAFLIARGPSAIIILPAYDRPMIKTPFSLEGVEPNADPGTPLGPGKVVAGTGGKTTFSRSYTKAEVSIDCAAFTANIVFK